MLLQKWSAVLEWRLMERTSTLFIPVSFPFIAAIFPSSQSPFGGRSSNQQLRGSTSSSPQLFLLAWSCHLLPSPWAWQPSGDHSSSAVPVWYTTIRLTWPVAWPLPSCLALRRNTGVLFHHFPWVSQKHFTSKAVDTSTEVLGVWGNVRVEFWFSGFGKIIVFLKQRKETEKKNNKVWWCLSIWSLWWILSKGQRNPLRLHRKIYAWTHNHYVVFEETLIGFSDLMHLWVKYWNWKLRAIPFPSFHS